MSKRETQQLNKDGYSISKLKQETAKRALTEEEIEQFIDADVIEPSSTYDAKNIFLFSFYNMGMNFIDIAYLTWHNIDNDRIFYIRKKTNKPITIKILPPVKDILDYYAQFTDEDDYIFPILSEIHKTSLQKKTRVKTAIKKINDELKDIGKIAEIDKSFALTTYVARHSWATIMRRKGFPVSLISEGMSHSNEKITQTYLDSFGKEALDDMNESLLNR